MRKALAHAWHAVKGDGCTSAPDFHVEYTACCNLHDADYTTGTDETGKRITRAQADARLRACMRAHSKTIFGRWIIAPLYWVGVRVGARAHWKTR